MKIKGKSYNTLLKKWLDMLGSGNTNNNKFKHITGKLRIMEGIKK